MLPRKTPGKGAMRDNWTFLSPEAGEQWLAYLAGQPWWFLCHSTTGRRSKPCLHDISGGDLACPYCPSASFLFGYCPLYRESDHRPVLVGLRQHSAEPVSRIARCARVLVARLHSEFNAVSVERHGSERYQTARSDRQCEPDLSGCLLRLWGIPELTQWCQSRPASTECPHTGEHSACASASGEISAAGATDFDQARAELERRRDEWLKQHPPAAPSTLGESLNGKAHK